MNCKCWLSTYTFPRVYAKAKIVVLNYYNVKHLTLPINYMLAYHSAMWSMHAQTLLSAF